VTVKHVVGGRNKQVLPQWKCHWCNIQFDNMGSIIFFECGLSISTKRSPCGTKWYWREHCREAC
jgi:hypothetical protein